MDDGWMDGHFIARGTCLQSWGNMAKTSHLQLYTGTVKMYLHYLTEPTIVEAVFSLRYRFVI